MVGGAAAASPRLAEVVAKKTCQKRKFLTQSIELLLSIKALARKRGLESSLKAWDLRVLNPR